MSSENSCGTMRKLLASTYKEVLLLLRDWGGLAILFFMPAVLIITITLIQESTFKAVGESQFPIILVDQDQGEIGQLVVSSLDAHPTLDLVTRARSGELLNEEQARALVSQGEYQIAIVIPAGISEELNEKVEHNVTAILEEMAVMPGEDIPTQRERVWDAKEINIYFDPAAGQTFRNSIKNNIEKMLANVETQKIYAVFAEQMGLNEEHGLLGNNLIEFNEIIAQRGDDGIIPNAVQHNVPAWILFGVFFIVVPLSINIVKEKNLGTYIRLRTSPIPYALIMAGKVITYSVICLIQFALMLLIARYVFPLIGLIPFVAGDKLLPMTLIAFLSGLAAIGIGTLIGTVARTQEQSAPFGAIFTIILAALGGVWVPTFIMPATMQKVSALSPMNWGISAFYDIILRNGSYLDILQPILYLLLCFLATALAALWYDKRKRAI